MAVEPFLLRIAGFGPVVEKSPYRARATRSNGAVQWSGPVHILGIRISSAFNQADNRRRLCRRVPSGRTGNSKCRRMQRFGTTAVLRSDVGSRLDQFVRHFVAIRCGGEM